MSVRDLARALYQAMERAEALRKKLAAAPEPEKDRLALSLRQAEAETAELRRLLDGRKENK